MRRASERCLSEDMGLLPVRAWIDAAFLDGVPEMPGPAAVAGLIEPLRIVAGLQQPAVAIPLLRPVAAPLEVGARLDLEDGHAIGAGCRSEGAVAVIPVGHGGFCCGHTALVTSLPLGDVLMRGHGPSPCWDFGATWARSTAPLGQARRGPRELFRHGADLVGFVHDATRLPKNISEK